MLDLNTIRPCSSFKYWFKPIEKVRNSWAVIDLSQDSVEVGILGENVLPDGPPQVALYEPNTASAEDIMTEFIAFKTRPEWVATKVVYDIEKLDQESLIEAYELRLLGILLDRIAKAGKVPDDHMKAAMNCIEWLRTTDFYNAPGSTQYHDSEPCGLLKHSLRVFNHITRLRYDEAFENVPIHSAALVALTHDWCKIGLYEMYMRNVKNEDTGKWEQVPSYRRNQKGVPLGHGVTSMFIVGKFFKLGVDEALALRWHMNRWNVADNEMNELQLANETYPLVHLLQFADQLSITKYAN